MVGLGGRLGRLCGRRRDGWMRSPPGCRYQTRARKGPADVGPAGPYKYLGKSLFYLLAYSFDSASRIFNMLCRITEASIILLCLIP